MNFHSIFRKPTGLHAALSVSVIHARFSRAVFSSFGALLLLAACWLWQSGERVQAYGRLTINAPADEAFALPEAKVGVEYEYQFQTEGGLAPLKWSVVGGVTPPGIRLEEDGQLRGAPTLAKAEAYAFVVEVADSAKTPQRFTLPCSMMVHAAPLRIVTGAPKLRILTKGNDSPPNAQAVNNNQSGGQADSQIADVSGSAVTEARPAASLAPAPVNQRREFSAPIPSKRVNPADFIRIYEDTVGANRILIYDPTVDERIRVEKLSADKASKLVIVPDPDLMDAELALNNLYMKATLAPRNAELEIEGYSKVGESRAAVQAQRAVAFQSVKNIIGKILTMAFTADDIVEATAAAKGAADKADRDPNADNVQREAKRKALNQILSEKLQLYSPEIEGIAAFFLDQENQAIVDLIGVKIFFVDGQTLQKIATQYQGFLRVALDSNDQEAQNAALKVLLERAQMVNKTFEGLKGAILRGRNLENSLERRKEYFEYGSKLAAEAIAELKKYIAEGHLSLLAANAEDGDRLTLSVEARGADGGTVGIPAVFEIAIKRFGPKLTVSDSFLFIKRLGLTENDILAIPNGRGLNRVNYAPSPGMTFGVNYFKRGDGAGSKFLRAIAPGVGVNVSFMNYNDPSFDLSTGRFTNTTGENVQVGAGIVGMLFHNNIQFSYGYNLNADFKRRYFGVGFSFIDFTKKVVNVIKE